MISIQNVSKRYKNVIGNRELKALDGISLEVGKGEVFGLLGPNGSGKTTLLRLMLGLIFPSGGKISVMGKNPRDVLLKRKIGYLPEHPYFYDFLTPVELLGFYASLFGISGAAKKKRVRDLIGKVGLAGFEKMRVRNFSKGMLQRLGLAVSLVNDPELIFLDEPTLGLDPMASVEIQGLLRELNARGKTIFLCSHLLAQVQDSCKRIGIIHKGRLLRVGMLHELLTQKGEMALVVRGVKEKDKLRDMARAAGAELVSVTENRDSLKDYFMKVINKR